MRKSALLIAMILLFLLCAEAALAYPGLNQNPTYTFEENETKTIIPDCFHLDAILSVQDQKGKVLKDPQDMFVSADQKLYVLDSDSGKILIYDETLTLERVMDKFTMPDGKSTKLSSPMGLFVSNDNLIYIADTKNQRILKVDQDANVLLVVNKPESFQGTVFTSFSPLKLVVDSIGRISVVAQNINMGLCQFDADGVFIGYMGAPKVKTDPITKLWKRLSTDKQKAMMEQFVPTEYSNVSMDSKGFIYGTISSLNGSQVRSEINDRSNPGNAAPLRKLNGTGSDVLKRNGRYSPLGNLILDQSHSVSRMIDVAIGPAESYTMLDGSSSLLYTYSEEGVLLCIFGGSGKTKESFERPVSVAYMGNKLLVLDAALSQVMVYIPTAYYQVVLEAITAKHNADFEREYEMWAEVGRQNPSFTYAYTGLGKVAMEEGDYQKAMEHFEYAGDKENYSDAKEEARKEYMTTAFPIVFGALGIAVLIWMMAAGVKKFRAYVGR